MPYNAKNGSIAMGDTTMDYITFGRGSRVLVMIPGLGDGLKTVKGLAFSFSFLYREYAKDFKVYVFSRKNKIPDVYTSRDMARDQKLAMDKLGISKADVLGVSQGGTIAQYLAIDYPEVINKLVLAVSYARQNETVRNAISGWIDFAKNKNYSGMFIDMSEKAYSESYLKKHRKLYPILKNFGKPKSYDKFIIMANACLTHDSYDELDKITCPTFVIGGSDDKTVGAEGSVELAEKIKDSKLYMYDGLSHGAYDEAKDFNHRVIIFLKEKIFLPPEIL